jgi:YVTN family beta-propeller protein
VGSWDDNTISVIDPTTYTVSTIRVGKNPIIDIAVTPDGTQIYVVHKNDHTISVIDTASKGVTNTIHVGHVGELPARIVMVQPIPW